LKVPIEKWSDLKQEKNNIRAELIAIIRPEDYLRR
jgi:hypothetical protein